MEELRKTYEREREWYELSDTVSFESVVNESFEIAKAKLRIAFEGKLFERLLSDLQAAHDREIRDTAQQEYHRGFEDGRHYMDAEHRAVAMQLRGLRFDGGSHENLSQIARAVYHSDWGWTQGACAALRDELVRLMGGVSDDTAEPMTTDEFIKYVEEDTRRLKGDGAMEVGDDTCACAGGGACAADCGRDSGEQEVSDGGTADDSADDSRGGYRGLSIHLDGLTGYDVLWNERQKAVCELRYIRDCLKGDSTCNSLNIANAIGAKLDVGDHLHESICDRLIHLLGGDQPSGIDVLRAMDEREAEGRITDELREFVGTFSKRLSISVAEVNAIADRIDEQFDRICWQHEAVLQETIDEMAGEIDKMRKEVIELRNQRHDLQVERGDLVYERDELKEKCAELSAELSHQRRRTERACGAVYSAERERDKLRHDVEMWRDRVEDMRMERDELQAKLDEYDRTHVELPRDRNGRVFVIGCDAKPIKRETEVSYTVSSMTLVADGWEICIQGDSYGCQREPSFFEVCDAKPDLIEETIEKLTLGEITQTEAIERIKSVGQE